MDNNLNNDKSNLDYFDISNENNDNSNNENISENANLDYFSQENTNCDNSNKCSSNTNGFNNEPINEMVVPPASALAVMYTTRLGIILSNISILCVILCLCSLLTVVFSVVIFLFAFVFMLLTFGLILLIAPGYWHMFTDLADVIGSTGGFLALVWPVVAPLGIITAIASLVLLLIDRQNRNVPRIVVSSIVLILTVAVLIGLVVMASLKEGAL